MRTERNLPASVDTGCYDYTHPPGWYKDCADSSRFRWWDGFTWGREVPANRKGTGPVTHWTAWAAFILALESFFFILWAFLPNARSWESLILVGVGTWFISSYCATVAGNRGNRTVSRIAITVLTVEFLIFLLFLFKIFTTIS